MRLLDLLKRLEYRCEDDSLIKKSHFCPECCAEKPDHNSWCELKAAIDQYSDAEAVVEIAKHCDPVDGHA